MHGTFAVAGSLLLCFGVGCAPNPLPPGEGPASPVTTVSLSMASPPPAPAAAPRATATESTPPADASALEDAAHAVLKALQSKDMDRLASLVHPELGLRFSPYAFVELDKDVVLTRAQLKGALRDSKPRRWGSFDGSGEPMVLSFARYFDTFVWSHDFTVAPDISVDRTIQVGNTISNLQAAYPGARFVELHFRGFDPKYTGMDWESLRLVLRPSPSGDGARWLLVGVIHDGWTI